MQKLLLNKTSHRTHNFASIKKFGWVLGVLLPKDEVG